MTFVEDNFRSNVFRSSAECPRFSTESDTFCKTEVDLKYKDSDVSIDLFYSVDCVKGWFKFENMPVKKRKEDKTKLVIFKRD